MGGFFHLVWTHQHLRTDRGSILPPDYIKFKASIQTVLCDSSQGHLTSGDCIKLPLVDELGHFLLVLHVQSHVVSGSRLCQCQASLIRDVTTSRSSRAGAIQPNSSLTSALIYLHPPLNLLFIPQICFLSCSCFETHIQ